MARLETSVPLSVQLYTLRHLDIPLQDKLVRIAEFGYQGVETLQDHGMPAAELKALLDQCGLQVSSTHVSLEKLDTDLDGAVAFNQDVGNHTLVISSLPREMRPTDAAGWQAAGARLGDLGRRCAQAGMRLAYHNHGFEMAVVEDRLAIDWMLSAADPAYLLWQPDLAWVQDGGADPAALLAKYAGRCPVIHAKDLAPKGENQDQMGLADVGSGILDWDTLLPAALAAGAEWLVVEHDLPKDPMASIAASAAFLRGKLARSAG